MSLSPRSSDGWTFVVGGIVLVVIGLVTFSYLSVVDTPVPTKLPLLLLGVPLGIAAIIAGVVKVSRS
ncbi:uncharacterized membrane protein HdeD (DUF308 family) [Microbacteriaceae bacterium SG_E_30_P1]|uniref:Uncharacterized membrane protein HdeD (DUF308 family) n=1 Tax=Antiquaquibacter oligotrophicus TaxID=2880260 RepID=A0ABT6KTV8_9MICO|nr:hypothetical protein [Antiquaquibacter oligotrophicus]MDH6182532.1 uncharacterized membrane protein HdeD (DUF308 family) [Antiquaquibacter oligotrophicus]UDF14499.1 hypothetical protein LH407_06460 [Antiquaquibacter oligotrophicus]